MTALRRRRRTIIAKLLRPWWSIHPPHTRGREIGPRHLRRHVGVVVRRRLGAAGEGLTRGAQRGDLAHLGVLHALRHHANVGARAAGDSLGTAFPSSHVAGVVTAAIIAWKWLPRPVAWLLIVESIGVMVATVYTQNHYAIDAVAGLVWAVVLQVMLLPLLDRLITRRATSEANIS